MARTDNGKNSYRQFLSGWSVFAVMRYVPLRTKYRGLSTTQRTMKLSIASVEMTASGVGVEMSSSGGRLRWRLLGEVEITASKLGLR